MVTLPSQKTWENQAEKFVCQRNVIIPKLNLYTYRRSSCYLFSWNEGLAEAESYGEITDSSPSVERNRHVRPKMQKSASVCLALVTQ